MKRRQLIVYLRAHGCSLLREGSRHSVFYNAETERTSTVPRHREIDDLLANKICKDLNIPKIKKQ